MKRVWQLLLAAALCVGLAGCSLPTPPPQTASDGTPWSEDWVTIGGAVGVETPEPFALLQNRDTMSSNQMAYAAWSLGEGEPFTTEDGEEATLYDAQAYVLLAKTESPEKAAEALEEWAGIAEELYRIESSAQEDYGGQEFTVVTYTYLAEDASYRVGASAFGVFRQYAVSVEIACRSEAVDNPHALLVSFLENFHYAGEE